MERTTNNATGQVKNYKVQTYDVSRQLKAIDSFEAQAVKDAQDTAKLVDTELTALQSALKNIESARPFDECTVEEIMAAEPSIEKKVEAMTKNHRWMPAGYKVGSIFSVVTDGLLTSCAGKIRRSVRSVDYDHIIGLLVTRIHFHLLTDF